MFWPFVLVSSIAAALIKLGALSVWVAVMSLTIKVMLWAAIIAALFLAFRRFIR